MTGILGYSLWRKTKAIGTLNFYPDRVSRFYMQGITPVFVLGLGVQNTSNQSFVLNSIAANAISNGYRVGNLSSFTPQVVNKNSQGILQVELKLNPLSLVNDLIDAFQTHNFVQDMRLQGYVNVDNLQMPLDITFKVGI